MGTMQLPVDPQNGRNTLSNSRYKGWFMSDPTDSCSPNLGIKSFLTVIWAVCLSENFPQHPSTKCIHKNNKYLYLCCSGLDLCENYFPASTWTWVSFPDPWGFWLLTGLTPGDIVWSIPVKRNLFLMISVNCVSSWSPLEDLTCQSVFLVLVGHYPLTS